MQREFGFKEDGDVLFEYYLIVFYCVEVFFLKERTLLSKMLHVFSSWN